MKIYKEKTRVKSYDVDKNGRLSIVQVFNFLQEAAFRHSVADKFGQPDLEAFGLVWMLSRMKVIFLAEVRIGETVEIESWVRSIKGALSERDFLLTRDGNVVVKATSLWACLSINSTRPSSIPNQIANRMIVHNTEEKEIKTSKIKSIDTPENSYPYKVKSSDIDMINHTNNVSYVRMVLDQMDAGKKISQIEINYLLQSFQEDELTIRTQKKHSHIHLSEVLNPSNEVVCRLRIE